MVPAPSYRCQEQQALVTGWHRGNVQFKAAWIFAAVFLVPVFYCEGPKNTEGLPLQRAGRAPSSSTGEREGFVGCFLFIRIR